MRFNRDLFTNADMKEVSITSFGIIDVLQGATPEVQLASACVVFKTIADHAGVPLSEAMTVVNNIMYYAEGKRPEFQAIEAYLKGEW